MDHRTDELETFKTTVNLTEFAAAHGYLLDRKASSRNSAVMVHPAGDKIIIARASDGHWTYFSTRDPQDHGSIIDFIQHRQGRTLGQVRKLLRSWINAPATPLPRPAAGTFVDRLEPITRDLAMVRARFEVMQPVEPSNSYLTIRRRIPSALLTHQRFVGRIRVDDRGNIIFPHYNRDGLCGFEIKNEAFTGFASGGTKGLWPSTIRDDDNALAITETAIDAASYAALQGHERTRFVSIAGQMNPEQPALLASAMRKLPAGSRVILALDNDDAGDALTARISAIFAEVSRSDLELIDHRPAQRGADWNDALRASSPPAPA